LLGFQVGDLLGGVAEFGEHFDGVRPRAGAALRIEVGVRENLTAGPAIGWVLLSGWTTSTSIPRARTCGSAAESA
jgi:hypothetical protein